MALLSQQSFASKDIAYFISNPTDDIVFTGFPKVTLKNVNGELLANDISILPSSWYLFPSQNNQLILGTDILLSSNGNLFFNGELLAQAGQISNIADWALYPAISNVDMDTRALLFGSNTVSVVSNDLRFNGITTSPTKWSSFPALSTVNLCNLSILNTSNILGVSNIIVSNTGSSALINSSVSLKASGGNRGLIELVASSGLTGIQGEVKLTAEGGNNGSLVTGGLVEITALTPVTNLPTLSSAIKLNAAGINSYAGAIPSIASLVGYNFIYGSVGVNICAGVPPIFPNTPFSSYVYGTGGVTLESGLLADVQVRQSVFGATTIKPYFSLLEPTSNLLITGRGTQKVDLSMVNTLSFSGVASITNVSSINGSGYTPTSNWATFNALNDLNMGTFNISNAGSYNGVVVEALSNWSSYPVLSSISLGSNAIREGAGFLNTGTAIEIFKPSTIASTTRTASLVFTRVVDGVADYNKDVLLFTFPFLAKPRVVVKTAIEEQSIAYLSDIVTTIVFGTTGVALTDSNVGTRFILTGGTIANYTISGVTTGSSWSVKNSSGANITVQYNGMNIGILYTATLVANSSFQLLYWNGLSLQLF